MDAIKRTNCFLRERFRVFNYLVRPIQVPPKSLFEVFLGIFLRIVRELGMIPPRAVIVLFEN